MPPHLIKQIETALQGAIAGQMSQLQIAIGTDQATAKRIRIVVLPDSIGEIKPIPEEIPVVEEKEECGSQEQP